MKKLIGVVILVLLLAGGVFALPDAISYQGRVFIMPGGTVPVPDVPGNSVIVRFYDDPSAGALLYTTPLYNDVMTVDGYFNMQITGAGSFGLLFKDDYWIEIEFNGETMFPRQQLTTAPYAGRAVYVENVSPFPDSVIYGPQQITSSSATLPTLAVTNTAGVGLYAEGLTGVAAVSNDPDGTALVVENIGLGTPMFVRGGNNSYATFQNSGVLIDSGASPAALYVSFTAGAWPAALIDAPNGQGLQVNGSGGGLGKAVIDVFGNPMFGIVTGLHALGDGVGHAGVSGTASNGGTGVYGVGTTGVFGHAEDNSAAGIIAVNDTAKGDDAGSALYVQGKLRIGPGTSSSSPSGAINLAAGVNPFFSVGNVLCNGGAYRVLVTPQNPVTAAGNPCSWWVDKQDGNFIIHIESGGAPTDNDVVFDYLIINN